MKFSISNIGWEKEDNGDVYELLHKYSFDGIDVAPGLVVEDVNNFSKSEIHKFRSTLDKHKLKVFGMQSLLYGTNELSIFGSEVSREGIFTHFEKIIEISMELGVKSWVFGSPKNRQRRYIDNDKAYQIAREFFAKAAEVISSKGIKLCLEPNPLDYGCDFITNTNDAFEFVKDIDDLYLNLDVGTLIMNNIPTLDIIDKIIEKVGHVHLSAPFLEGLEFDNSIYLQIINKLKKLNYKGVISIEVKKTNNSKNIDYIESILKYVSGIR